MINFDFLSAIIFYVGILLFIFFNKSKFENQAKVFFLYRTKKGIGFMKKFGQKHKYLITLFASFGVIVSIYFLLKLPEQFFEMLIDLIGTVGDVKSQFGLVLPGIKIPGSAFFIPFWYGIISLFTVVVLHEVAHGIAAISEGVRINNTGFGFLLFIPVFFVEPDEKQMMKKSHMTRARVAAAGPFMNLSLAFLVGLFLTYVLVPLGSSLFMFGGVIIEDISPGMPAELAGIVPGTIITKINGQKINDLSHFIETLDGSFIGQETTFTSKEGEDFVLQTVKDPNNESRALFGISFDKNTVLTQKGEDWGVVTKLFTVFSTFLQYFIFLSLGIGIMNFLPVWAVDGGQIFYNLASIIFKKEQTAMKVSSTYFSFTIILLLLNILLPIFL